MGLSLLSNDPSIPVQESSLSLHEFGSYHWKPLIKFGEEVNGDLCMANRPRLFLVCTLEFSVTKKDEGTCLCFSLLLLVKGVGLTVLRFRTFCMDNPQAVTGPAFYL